MRLEGVGLVTPALARFPLRVRRRRRQAVPLNDLRGPARLPTLAETREWIGTLLILGGGLMVLGTALRLFWEGIL